jgi:hypothetical protein
MVELETWAGEETANAPIVHRARARKRDIGLDLSALDRTIAETPIINSRGDAVNSKADWVWSVDYRCLGAQDIDHEQYDYHEDGECDQGDAQTIFSWNKRV